VKEHDPHGLGPLVATRAGHAAVKDPRYREAVEAVGLGELFKVRLAILE
jgi:hypothetical protein